MKKTKEELEALKKAAQKEIVNPSIDAIEIGRIRDRIKRIQKEIDKL